ncbi:methylated-DNA--[protein]-cysteine S-methyltransferase [Lactiplantibacillus songbeiensis]|uniref:Methylated-DNA--[protein]-cysteine S-methyltransferase n=1 Tax=Lactiplantibacillus songbeiensis TaxID=2559920 RepID=A0ABW4C5B6_9LACO|nr:methylated-DNA--[protein]-cysteine S-methyltransferase [Lactiplantibacillus songbeiensis]
MQLILTNITIQQRHYWLGSTTHGLAFVGSPNGAADEWRQFFPQANASIDEQANQVAGQALTAYLNGQAKSFDLPLDQTTGTALQQQVWQALQQLPYGQTCTYSDLAAQLNRPQAVRAIASAVGRNPLLVVVPCHRVLRKDGQLGGYRGGLPMKRRLLALEQTN